MKDELAERLPQGTLQVERLEPAGRNPTRGGLPLADLVAIDQQNVGAAASQFARHREPGEARAADQNVAIARERGPLDAPLGRSPWHCERMIGACLGALL